MMLVNVDRGKEEGAIMAKELGERENARANSGGGIILIDEEAAEQQHEVR